MEALLRRLGADGGAVLAVEEAHPAGSDQGGRLLPHLNWPCTLRSAFRVGPCLRCPSDALHLRRRQDSPGIQRLFPCFSAAICYPRASSDLQPRHAL